MAGKLKVIDNAKKYYKISSDHLDSALGRMAHDIKQVTKITIPYKTGELQGSIQTVRAGKLQHSIKVVKEYAAYQERGMRKDGSRPVRNYTTPGTGPHALEKAGVKVTGDALNYFKQAVNLARL